jgi:LacI family transcriptional regulator
VASSRRANRITVLEVADKAGVSPATVSRAFNRPELLKPDTLTHVLQIAQDLQFRPNALARGLVSGRSGFAALIVPDITDPFFGRLASSLDQALRSEGKVLVVCHSSEQASEELHITQLLEERQIDGVVWVSEAPGSEGVSPIESFRIPKVMIERLPESVDQDVVLLDKSRVSEAINYLVDLGHQRIGIVTGHLQTYGGRELFKEFARSMKAMGLDLPDEYVYSADFKFRRAMEGAASLLSLSSPPTAVFVGSDRMAHGFMTGLAQLGAMAPRDLSVVAFATSLVDSLVYPPLTSIQSSYQAIGETAAKLLMDRMRDPEAPTQRVVVPTEFIIRESCQQVG